MKLSEIILKFERYKELYGDVEVLYHSGDGRESWMSGFNPEVSYVKEWPMKQKGYVIKHSGW